jgi:uncharacterized protein (TIGR03435 family)
MAAPHPIAATPQIIRNHRIKNCSLPSGTPSAKLQSSGYTVALRRCRAQSLLSFRLENVQKGSQTHADPPRSLATDFSGGAIIRTGNPDNENAVHELRKKGGFAISMQSLQHNHIRNVCLAAMGLALAASMAVSQASPATADAQAQPGSSDAKLPEFATAIVRPSSPNRGHMGLLTYTGGRINAGHRTLRMLAAIAFNVQDFQVKGGPEWADNDQFDIEARPPESSPAASYVTDNAKLPPTGELRQMLLALLIDRFQLQFHRETREGQIYLLERGPKELKLTAPRDPNTFPWFGNVWERGMITDTRGIAGQNISMPLLAERLAPYLYCPVVDRTGIEGSFDFRFENYEDEALYASHQDAIVASILDSFLGIGLKLTRSRGPIDIIVIDGAQLPATD